MTTEIAAAGDLLGLFPPGSRVDPDGELVVGGCRLADLAAAWGTPLYVVEEAAVRAQVRRFRRALEDQWRNSRMVFASKAFPCTAMYRLMASEGIGVDVAGAGELAMALAGGVDPARIVMHGNAKTPAELQMAVDAGVGLIVIDNTDDIDRLEDLARPGQPVLVRVIPGVRPDTHEAVATGQSGSKFGLAIPAARAAIARLRRSGKLRLDGLHMHIGSQILAAGPYAQAIEAIAGLGDFPVYNLGGGLGVPYISGQTAPGFDPYLTTLIDAAHAHLGAEFHLVLEPGRALVANSTVTMYSVETIKHNVSKWVAVDGGMSDNLRPMLYGAVYEAVIADRPLAPPGELCRLAGKHCESGDVLIEAALLPDPAPGDVVVTPATGAYGHALANNYNGVPRPPVIFCSGGSARVVVRRETYADLAARDVE